MKGWVLFMVSMLGSTANAKEIRSNQKKVLIALSGVDYISLKEGGQHKTGYFMSELVAVLRVLAEANYSVVFANPTGRKSAIDPASNSAQWFKSEKDYAEAKQLLLSQAGLEVPRMFGSFSELELDSFDGIFVPGGYAPMEDLYKDRNLGRILLHFHSRSKPTGLICHGPIALLSAQSLTSTWVYKDYRMTIVSENEERQEEDAGHIGGHQMYYVENSLREAGGQVQVAAPWSSNVVEDRELITGQNPMSAEATAQAFSRALRKGI